MKKLFAKLKKVFPRIFSWIEKNSKIAVDAVNILKSVVESPIMDVAVNITPTTVDNKLLPTVRKVVAAAALKMAITHGILQSAKDEKEALTAIIDYLRSQFKERRAGFYVELAGLINEGLANGKLSFAEAAGWAQLAYDEFYGKK